jgi:pSer/pThr/pTyr-binding forkhead associated (FHA) protein
VLLPALIDSVSPPARYRTIQAADLVERRGRREHIGLLQLIAAIRAASGVIRRGTTSESEESSPRQGLLERPIAIAEVETGESRGRSLFVTGSMTSVTIGRSRDCDFVVDDDYVSRSHCRLEVQVIHDDVARRGQFRFVLIDSGSHAGTTVNGKRVDREELRDGDRFQIGIVRFKFRILDEALPSDGLAN